MSKKRMYSNIVFCWFFSVSASENGAKIHDFWILFRKRRFCANPYKTLAVRTKIKVRSLKKTKNYQNFEWFPTLEDNYISFSREARRKIFTFCAEGAEKIFLRALLFLVEGGAGHTATLTSGGA